MSAIKWLFWFISFAVFFYLGAKSPTKLGAVACIVAMGISFAALFLPVLKPYLGFDKRLYELIDKIGTKDKQD